MPALHAIILRKCSQKTVTKAAIRGMSSLLAAVLLTASSAYGCTELPAGSRFWIRLTSPVSSYNAKPGTPVRGFLLESPLCDNATAFPIRTEVEGHVRSAHRVGLGLWHETAAIDLDFDRIALADGSVINIHGRVQEIDNAREQVKKGVIRGIRATDTLQGTISSRLKYMPSIHLYPDPFLLGYKMLFPVFPEAEICLEAGTDLEVALTASAPLPDNFASLRNSPAVEVMAHADHVAEGATPDNPDLSDRQVARDLSTMPDRTTTRQGKDADVINLIFTGTRTELEMAFATAGWLPSEHISKTTVRHQIYAFLAKTDYSSAPMSAQLLAGKAPDLTVEKTFDSYEKRDHLRIWSLPPDANGTELWASASVRETGATLSVRHKGFMHHVSPDLAEAQHVVVRDLLAADCIASLGSIARPDLDHVLLNATGEIFRTDGTLTVIHLKPCGTDYAGAGFSNRAQYQPANKVYRYARKEILTVRSDLWRANILYAGYDLTRITVQAFRRNALHRADMQSFRQGSQPPISPTTSADARPPANANLSPD